MMRWLLPIAMASCYHEVAPPPAQFVIPTCKRERLSEVRTERVVVDDRHVYFASYMSPIKRISLRDHRSETFAVDVNIMGLAIDNTHVYWSSLSGERSVKRRAKAGGPVEIIATEQPDPEHLAVDESAVYWTTINGREVMQWHKATRTTTRFAPGGGGLALDRTHVYWARAFDLSEYMSRGIGRKAKAGGDAVFVNRDDAIDQSTDHMAQQLASDGTHVYWTVEYSGEVRRAPVGGSHAETFSVGTAMNSAPVPAAGDLAVDATHVYWETGGMLLRRSKRGGAVEVVVPDERTIRTFALTADAIYWSSDRGIYRLVKAPCGL
jgi:hypothetical protein